MNHYIQRVQVSHTNPGDPEDVRRQREIERARERVGGVSVRDSQKPHREHCHYS